MSEKDETTTPPVAPDVEGSAEISVLTVAPSPEMFLQHRADGKVFCRWTDGNFVEVVPAAELEWVLQQLRKRDAEISFLKAEKMRLERLAKLR